MATPGGSNLLKFPSNKPSSEVCRLPTPIVVQTESFDFESTLEFYQLAVSLSKRSEEIISFMDKNRADARKAGIESLAIEISSIMEGSRFAQVLDALEDAVYRNAPVQLTPAGLAKLHRLETVVSEADGIITANAMDWSTGSTRASEKTFIPVMGQASGKSSSESSTWIPFLIIGTIGVVGIVAVVAFLSRDR